MILKDVPTTSDIEVDAIEITVPVRYGTEDIPDDFPLRAGDQWKGTVDLNTRKIREWPEGESGDLSMKVCDMGTYRLLSGANEVACREEDYVPDCIPGSYGDYIELEIQQDGTVSNWNADAEKVKRSFFRVNDD